MKKSLFNRAVSFYLCLFLPVSQSNSSLKKHRSRSIFSPFFCCFRNYNDYRVEPPPTNNKTLSLPPLPEENGSPPKVKLIFLCCGWPESKFHTIYIQAIKQTLWESVNILWQKSYDLTRELQWKVTFVWFCYKEACYGLPFPAESWGWGTVCAASLSSLHKFFQLLQTRCT